MPNTTTAAIVLTAAALGSLALSGPGTRWGWWHFRAGLFLFALSGVLALFAGVLSGLALRGAPAIPAICVLIAFPIGFVVFGALAGARGKPMIHDISTDLDDPPRFAAVLPLRGAGSHPVDAISVRTLEAQRRAYGDIQPKTLAIPPEQALRAALGAARSLGWEIVAADVSPGIFEATDATAWFGFRDDIVVRIRPDGQGSRIDVRSASRVGRNDVGKNAARIRAFLAML